MQKLCLDLCHSQAQRPVIIFSSTEQVRSRLSCSDLQPQDAYVMVAEKRKLLFLLKTLMLHNTTIGMDKNLLMAHVRG